MGKNLFIEMKRRPSIGKKQKCVKLKIVRNILFSMNEAATTDVIPKSTKECNVVISMSGAKRNLIRLLPGIRRVEVTKKVKMDSGQAHAGMTVKLDFCNKGINNS